MPRVAFELHIKPGMVEQYEEAHRHVWPELLAKLKAVGISHYSIFRREHTLLLVMDVEDFESAWKTLDADPVNQRWQREMSDLFAPLPQLPDGERFPMWKEVFYLE